MVIIYSGAKMISYALLIVTLTFACPVIGEEIDVCAGDTICKVNEVCIPEPKICVYGPCPQYKCVLADSLTCADYPCKSSEICVPRNIECYMPPCPQYTCELDPVHVCLNNPCKRHEKCIPNPKECFTTPCPQYDCVINDYLDNSQYDYDRCHDRQSRQSHVHPDDGHVYDNCRCFNKDDKDDHYHCHCSQPGSTYTHAYDDCHCYNHLVKNNQGLHCHCYKENIHDGNHKDDVEFDATLSDQNLPDLSKRNISKLSDHP